MNKKQKKVLIIVALVIIGMFLFPPFHYVSQGSERSMGYSFILSPPNPYPSYANDTVVDTGMLFAQFLVVFVVGGVTFAIDRDQYFQEGKIFLKNKLALFAEPSYFGKIQTGFWIIFILFPLFTGLLDYDWLPNEYPDPKYYDILASHKVCRDIGNVNEECADKPDVWKNKITEQISTYNGFARHRESESFRMACAWFLYGLIGCAFFALCSAIKTQGKFFHALKRAVFVDFVIAAVMCIIFLLQD